MLREGSSRMGASSEVGARFIRRQIIHSRFGGLQEGDDSFFIFYHPEMYLGISFRWLHASRKTRVWDVFMNGLDDEASARFFSISFPDLMDSSSSLIWHKKATPPEGWQKLFYSSFFSSSSSLNTMGAYTPMIKVMTVRTSLIHHHPSWGVVERVIMLNINVTAHSAVTQSPNTEFFIFLPLLGACCVTRRSSHSENHRIYDHRSNSRRRSLFL